MFADNRAYDLNRTRSKLGIFTDSPYCSLQVNQKQSELSLEREKLKGLNIIMIVYKSLSH